MPTILSIFNYNYYGRVYDEYLGYENDYALLIHEYGCGNDKSPQQFLLYVDAHDVHHHDSVLNNPLSIF